MSIVDEVERKYDLGKEREKISVSERVSDIVERIGKMDENIIKYRQIIKNELKDLERINRDIERWKTRKEKVEKELENARELSTNLNRIINALRRKINQAKVDTVASQKEFEEEWDSFKSTLKTKEALERGAKIETDMKQSLNIMDRVSERGTLPKKARKLKREVEE